MAPEDGLSILAGLAPTLSVGILTADLLSLGSELALLERAGVGVAHVDVMDGCFCPMMTVGPPVVRAMKTPLLKDVHLMIDEPLTKVGDYVSAGADIVTVHVEATAHVHRVLQQLGAPRWRRWGRGSRDWVPGTSSGRGRWETSGAGPPSPGT